MIKKARFNYYTDVLDIEDYNDVLISNNNGDIHCETIYKYEYYDRIKTNIDNYATLIIKLIKQVFGEIEFEFDIESDSINFDLCTILNESTNAIVKDFNKQLFELYIPKCTLDNMNITFYENEIVPELEICTTQIYNIKNNPTIEIHEVNNLEESSNFYNYISNVSFKFFINYTIKIVQVSNEFFITITFDELSEKLNLSKLKIYLEYLINDNIVFNSIEEIQISFDIKHPHETSKLTYLTISNYNAKRFIIDYDDYLDVYSYEDDYFEDAPDFL